MKKSQTKLHSRYIETILRRFVKRTTRHQHCIDNGSITLKSLLGGRGSSQSQEILDLENRHTVLPLLYYRSISFNPVVKNVTENVRNRLYDKRWIDIIEVVSTKKHRIVQAGVTVNMLPFMYLHKLRRMICTKSTDHLKRYFHFILWRV